MLNNETNETREEKKPRPRRHRIFDYVTPAALVVFILDLIGIPIHIIAYQSRGFADVWNVTVCAFLRRVVAVLTNWIPFSLGEVIALALIPAMIAFIAAVIVMTVKGSRSVWRLITSVLACAGYFYFLFSVGYVAGYNTSTVDVKLGMRRDKCTAQELYKTAVLLRDKTAEYLDGVTFAGNGMSVMPYSHKEMNDLLIEAYSKASEKYDFIPTFYSRVKDIMISEPMTYTHLSGVYTLYTGEANINVNFPDYTLPFTACHELSHQRGINREDEANFMAFIVSIESGDPYILYSAYQNMFEYVMNALYSADKDLYSDAISGCDPRVINEMVAYNKFYEKYRENKAAKVTNTINDSYIKASGQEAGSKSYGLVVDLCVAYYRDVIAE